MRRVKRCYGLRVTDGLAHDHTANGWHQGATWDPLAPKVFLKGYLASLVKLNLSSIYPPS